MTKAIRIVLANNSLAGYPQGGGHWTCFLQYLFGLKDLGHELFWLELLCSSGDRGLDQRCSQIFLQRFERYGFKERCALLLYDPHVTDPTLDSTCAVGMSKRRIREIAGDTDLLWNFACSLRPSLLSMFKRRVLIDLDPGHLQVSALTWEMGIHAHQVFLTVGTKLHDSDCQVPTLGVQWHRFLPFVYLPMWNVAPDPGSNAPFSSVTQWTWEQLELHGRALSVSKRDAYLKYIELPKRSLQPFELAVNIDPNDDTGDRESLLKHGWRLVDPHRVASSPSVYQNYIKQSRAEFCCPKPIHRELNSGWFSDRSACYLATGRPVLIEDTGFQSDLPTGKGLFAFYDIDDAVEKVANINADYPRHARAARNLAEEFLDSGKCLPRMLDACS